MHFYNGYHFLGMHLIWWIVWIALLAWIFFLPLPIPNKNWGPSEESALDMLQKRYAAGEISTEEYEERKAVLEKER
jgi:putative membrane protein